MKTSFIFAVLLVVCTMNLHIYSMIEKAGAPDPGKAKVVPVLIAQQPKKVIQPTEVTALKEVRISVVAPEVIISVIASIDGAKDNVSSDKKLDDKKLEKTDADDTKRSGDNKLSQAEVIKKMSKVFRVIGFEQEAMFQASKVIGFLLMGIPEKTIATGRAHDFYSDLLSHDPCTAIESRIVDILSRACLIRVRDTTLLQHAFQHYLNNGLRKNNQTMYNKVIIKELLQYPFDLGELYYASFYFFRKLRISVLHAAVMLGDSDLVDLILKKMAQGKYRNVNLLDSDGLTPLHRLILANNALFESTDGKKDKKLNDEEKRLNAEHIKCARLLLDVGANQKITFVTGTWSENWCRKKARIVAEKYSCNPEMVARLQDVKKRE